MIEVFIINNESFNSLTASCIAAGSGDVVSIAILMHGCRFMADAVLYRSPQREREAEKGMERERGRGRERGVQRGRGARDRQRRRGRESGREGEMNVLKHWIRCEKSNSPLLTLPHRQQEYIDTKD